MSGHQKGLLSCKYKIHFAGPLTNLFLSFLLYLLVLDKAVTILLFFFWFLFSTEVTKQCGQCSLFVLSICICMLIILLTNKKKKQKQYPFFNYESKSNTDLYRRIDYTSWVFFPFNFHIDHYVFEKNLT